MAMKVCYTTMNGRIISENRNGVKRDYVADSLGSTVALLDNTQTKTDTFTYWPYGELKSRTGTTATPFLFVGTQGYYTDSTQRTYVRARILLPPLGRWMTEDPIGFGTLDLNLFRYTSNSPTSWIDRSGLFDTKWCLVFCLAAGPLHGACMDACTTAGDLQELQKQWDKIRKRKSTCRKPTTVADCFLCPGTGNLFQIACEQCCGKLFNGDEDTSSKSSNACKCQEQCQYLAEHNKRPPGRNNQK